MRDVQVTARVPDCSAAGAYAALSDYSRYAEVAESYTRGIERLIAEGRLLRLQRPDQVSLVKRTPAQRGGDVPGSDRRDRDPLAPPARRPRLRLGLPARCDDLRRRRQRGQWTPGPAILPAGIQGAVLYGDPTKEGLFSMRFKLPKGYRVAPHFQRPDSSP